MPGDPCLGCFMSEIINNFHSVHPVSCIEVDDQKPWLAQMAFGAFINEKPTSRVRSGINGLGFSCNLAESRMPR